MTMPLRHAMRPDAGSFVACPSATVRRGAGRRFAAPLLATMTVVALAGADGLTASVQAQEGGGNTQIEVNGPVELTLVQQAAGMKFDGKTLTLEGVSPSTTFFSARPEPTVGQLTTSQFVKLWNASQEGFKKDPPNAALSFIGDKNGKPVTIELVNVSGSGDTLSYSINVLDGTLPESGGAVSMSVDPVFWQLPQGWTAPFLLCRYTPYWANRVCRGSW